MTSQRNAITASRRQGSLNEAAVTCTQIKMPLKSTHINARHTTTQTDIAVINRVTQKLLDTRGNMLIELYWHFTDYVKWCQSVFLVHRHTVRVLPERVYILSHNIIVCTCFLLLNIEYKPTFAPLCTFELKYPSKWLNLDACRLEGYSHSCNYMAI